MPAIATFTPEELELHGHWYASAVKLATVAEEDPAERLTWSVMIGLNLQNPNRREDADKLDAVRRHGWDVHEFYRIASAFDTTEERYCQRCEGWLEVAFGSELRVWRMCPTCGPREAPFTG